MMSGARMFLGLLLVLTALLVPAPVLGAADETPDLPHEEWMAIFLQGQRVGYVHGNAWREEDVVVSRTRTKLTLRRYGTDVTMRMEALFRERVDGTPLSFSTMQKTSGMEIRTEGTISDGTLNLVITQGGRRREKAVEWDAETLFPYAIEQKTRALELERGAEFTVKAFSPEVSTTEPVEVTLTVIGPEAVDVLGVTHDAIKVEMRISKLPNIVETTWVDSDHNVLVMTMPLMDFRLVRCTKAYALAKVEPAELAAAVMVKPDKPLPRVAKLKRLVVKLSMVDGSPFAVELPSEGHQRVVERTKESTTIEISPALTKTEEKDLEQYLAASTYVDCEDERIIAAAREAVGDETDPWRKAQRLRRAVHELIDEKSFGVAMGGASEVIETKEGDCTEHAVLLAAMARVEGLPSRGVSGLMYIYGRFGYHMWTQVYVDGAWRDVDAVLPGRDFDAGHIRLSTSALGDDDSLVDLAAFAAVFGNLKIEVVEREYVGQKEEE